MSRKRVMALTIAVGAIATIALGDFDLSWKTIDGGGEMWTIAGNYELSGTIGQPDATLVTMMGGDYKLTGGFWQPASRRIPEPHVIPAGPAEPPDEDYKDAEELPLPQP